MLFLSLATSGLPKSSGALPWPVRICASLCDDSGRELDHYACHIRADGRHIDPGATRVHGIRTLECEQRGVDEVAALMSVVGLRASGKRTKDRPGLISSARTLVCWDADFVTKVIDRAFANHGEPSRAWLRPGLTVVSLQDTARPWCKLPSEDDTGGYRAPTRDEVAFEFWGAPVRELPHTPDDNLRLEQRIHAALCECNALENAA